jgi:hypothetical protein
MARVVAAIFAVLAGCNQGDKTSAASGRAAASPRSTPPDDAAVAIDASVPPGTVSADSQQALTAYVVKLRALPAAIRAAKKPPKTCAAADLAAAGAKPRATSLTMEDLDGMAGNTVDYKLDPTSFMLHLVSQYVNDLQLINDAALGHREFPTLFDIEPMLSPLVVVIRATKLEVPQPDTVKQFWPGELRGTIYIVDPGATRVLCAAPIAVVSATSVDMIKTGLKDRRGHVTWIDSDVPKVKLENDFAERGHAALHAVTSKLVPGIELQRLRD